MKLLIELSTADPDGTASDLWEDMKQDLITYPKRPLTLETQSLVADVKVIKELP